MTAVIDGPNHVSVKSNNDHEGWIRSKQNANIAPHPNTVALYAISMRIKIK